MAVVQTMDNCRKAPVTEAVTAYTQAQLREAKLLNRLREGPQTGSEKEVLMPTRITRRAVRLSQIQPSHG